MKAAHDKQPGTTSRARRASSRVHIDPKTGLRAYAGEEDGIDEVFLAGTEPTEVSAPDAGAADAALVPADGEAPPPTPGSTLPEQAQETRPATGTTTVRENPAAAPDAGFARPDDHPPF